MEYLTVNEKNTLDTLAGCIAEIFQSHITLDADALHFIHSTCCAATPGQIRSILDDPANSDRETILCLIFFPDASIQIRLEPVIEKISPREIDLRALASDILRRTPTATVHLPEPGESFVLPIDYWIVAHFLSLLNLSATIDPGIVAAMNQSKDRPSYLPVKVKLRNARRNLTEKKISWLISFLTAVNGDADGFLDCFDFALEFISDIADGVDIFGELCRLKMFYMKAVEQYAQYEALILSTNMESVMAGGLRTPYIHKEDAMKKIGIIDHLCLELYGAASEMKQPVYNLIRLR